MKQAGLTIVETIIVIGIFAVLFSIALGPGPRVCGDNKTMLPS